MLNLTERTKWKLNERIEKEIHIYKCLKQKSIKTKTIYIKYIYIYVGMCMHIYI